MTLDPTLIAPTPHRLLVATTRMLPTASPLFPGFKEPPPDYHPSEVPPFVRKRLINFLEGRHPIPPVYLWNIIPPSEVASCRSVYRQLRALDMGPGDAILEMGLMARNLGYNLPEASIARVLARGCDCTTAIAVIISSTAGEPLDNDHCIIRCSEALAATSAQADAQAARDSATAAENRRRGAFAALRSA